MPPMARFLYLARHGETDWNVAGRWQGHTDVPLNETGRAQARALVPLLRVVGVGAAVSSDLSRARETAGIAAAGLGVAVAYSDTALRERSFGLFEGLTREECAERHPEAWRAWLEERRAPSGAESQEQVAARVVAAVERVARQVANEVLSALVVTHGGALRALVAAVTGQMPPLVKNGDVWRVTWHDRLVDAKKVEPPGA